MKQALRSIRDSLQQQLAEDERLVSQQRQLTALKTKMEELSKEVPTETINGSALTNCAEPIGQVYTSKAQDIVKKHVDAVKTLLERQGQYLGYGDNMPKQEAVDSTASLIVNKLQSSNSNTYKGWGMWISGNILQGFAATSVAFIASASGYMYEHASELEYYYYDDESLKRIDCWNKELSDKYKFLASTCLILGSTGLISGLLGNYLKTNEISNSVQLSNTLFSEHSANLARERKAEEERQRKAEEERQKAAEQEKAEAARRNRLSEEIRMTSENLTKQQRHLSTLTSEFDKVVTKPILIGDPGAQNNGWTDSLLRKRKVSTHSAVEMA